MALKEVRGQLSVIGSLPPPSLPVRPRDWTQMRRLGRRHLYPQTCLSDPSLCFETGSLTKLGIHWQARLAGQRADGEPPFPLSAAPPSLETCITHPIFPWVSRYKLRSSCSRSQPFTPWAVSPTPQPLDNLDHTWYYFNRLFFLSRWSETSCWLGTDRPLRGSMSGTVSQMAQNNLENSFITRFQYTQLQV